MLVLQAVPGAVKAQGVVKGFEYGEIINIAQAYKAAPSLSFDVQINLADSARQDSIVETINGSYKIQNGLFWAMIDSTEMVQGTNYSVSVFHTDSVIAVGAPVQYPGVLQLPFMDSLFKAQNIDSMCVTQTCDSVRSLRMYFGPSSFYSGYTINYDLNTYLINSITYFAKTPAYEDSTGCGTSAINIAFSNYSTQPIDYSYFQESKFIYSEGGQLYVQPAYTGFQLMVNTSTKPN